MDFIKTHRLPDDQYYKESFPKNQIYLHHSVGGSAISTFNWWMMDPGRIGTAYIIERDGSIFEVFDPQYWAHHLGLKHPDNRSANEMSIGIELASEGALTQKDGKLYAFDGRQYYRSIYVDLIQPWRGYRFFDAYDPPQIDSAIKLVNYLCDRFSIPRRIITGDRCLFDIGLLKFNGVLTHCNVREDKTDVNPSFPFNRLFNEEVI
jgi:N-acetyl-anhydromuramyl-L-alanine amidase AmpD